MEWVGRGCGAWASANHGWARQSAYSHDSTATHQPLRDRGRSFGSLALPFILEQQSLKQLIEWQLQTHKKLAEFGEPNAHVVETHLINNRLHFEDILSKQRDAPFPIIQDGCTRNELPNSADVLAPNATEPAHQLLSCIT